MPSRVDTDLLARALAVIRQHPAVVAATDPVVDAVTGIAVIDVTFQVNLPNAWSARGTSPNGVHAKEIVRMAFSPAFPLIPPVLCLRADFDRNLPHIQPWVVCDRPVPCIFDGRLSELLHQEGLPGVLNQMAIWLDRAALGQLIDPKQGWEPVRRDELDDYIVADGALLRSEVSRDGGHKFFAFEYLQFTTKAGATFIHGEIANEVLKLSPQTLRKVFIERDFRGDPSTAYGKSVALLVWPGKLPSGAPILADRYAPESVGDIDGLVARAVDYGCQEPLKSALSWLSKCVAGYREAGPFAIAVVLCARRPFDVIGAGSAIEICPYITEVHAPVLLREAGKTPARPAGHRHRIASTLLRRIAGDDRAKEPPRWTLLGCGSLGSKIAIHLARTGHAPGTVVDSGTMSPHNAARHALLPPTDDLQLLWTDAKSKLLANAIRGLGQDAAAVPEDIVAIANSAERSRAVWPRRTWAVVNATASLNVRETLAAAPLDQLPSRVIDVCLFAGGQLGLLTIEGPGRNPNVGDLTAESYEIFREDPAAARLVFSAASASRQATGEGCGSFTMAMSDGRLSLFAAAMAEIILAAQRSGLPSLSGHLAIGRLTDDGIGLNWFRHDVPSIVNVETEDGERWHVRLNARATKKSLKRSRDGPMPKRAASSWDGFRKQREHSMSPMCYPLPQTARGRQRSLS